MERKESNQTTTPPPPHTHTQTQENKRLKEPLSLTWMVGLMTLEKMFNVFPIDLSMGAKDGSVVANLDHRSMVGRIFVEDH